MEISRRDFIGGASSVVAASFVGFGGVISYVAGYPKERDHAAAILENEMYDAHVEAIIEDREFDYDFAVEEDKMYDLHAEALREDAIRHVAGCVGCYKS